MKITVGNKFPENFHGVAAFARIEEGQAEPEEARIDQACWGDLSKAIKRECFKGKARQVVGTDTPRGRSIVVGLGKKGSLPIVLRDFAAIAVQEAYAHHYRQIVLEMPWNCSPDMMGQIVMGLFLGAYRFRNYLSQDEDAPPEIEEVYLRSDSWDYGDSDVINQAIALAEAVCEARTWVNMPPNICTPNYLANRAYEIGHLPHLNTRIIYPVEMERLGMNGILAVGRGSSNAPCLIHITYTPPSSTTTGGIAFVGKGITFDSGGLSIKPAKSMEDMHIDMAGGAVVLNTMRVISAMQPSFPVHAIVAAAENMTGSAAYRPTDILRMYNGKTVEVLNTDAEGRLVLADVLHYAGDLNPRCIVDLATLTGACMVGLGPNIAGLFSPSDDLAAEVMAAANATGERIHRLPLDPDMATLMKSRRADLKNISGSPYGGAITGALFLQNFVGETPWAHLDIAGPTLFEGDKPKGHIVPGATGFGVLTLVEMVRAAMERGAA